MCETHLNVQTGDFCPVCLVDERDELRERLAGLVDAVRPVLAAHKSGTAGRQPVTGQQITAAWAAFDEAAQKS